MALDNEANIYITGSSRGTGAAGRDYATVKYNSDGVKQWSIRYDAGFGHDEAYSIAVNSNGEVSVCGYSVGNGTGRDYAVVKYSSNPTDVEETPRIIPLEFSLYQNYPNPFNPATKISFFIPQSSFVSLTVYEITGREVVNLINQQMNAGVYSAHFSAENLSSEIYFYRLQAGSFIQTKKMILMK